MEPDYGMGVFFGLFGLLYFAVALFLIVLSVVFMFKAMSFMKNKTENDRRLLQAIERLDNKNTTFTNPKDEGGKFS
jgi:uncharacterized membrane protein